MIDLQKLAVPLTIGAAVIGIYAFTRGNSATTPVSGNLPTAAPVPTYAAVPALTYNVLPGVSSNAGQNSYLGIPLTQGLISPGYSGPLVVSQGTSASGSSSGGSSCCGCGANDTPGGWDTGISWVRTIQRNSQLT